MRSFSRACHGPRLVRHTGRHRWAIQSLTGMRLRESNYLWPGCTSREAISALCHTERRPPSPDDWADDALLKWIVSRASGGYSEHARVGRISYTLSRDTTLQGGRSTGLKRPPLLICNGLRSRPGQRACLRSPYPCCRPARLRARIAHRLSRAGSSAGQNRCVRRVWTKNARHEASAQRWTTPRVATWRRCQ